MKQILIVEDDFAYIKLLHNILAESSQVIDANDGKQGLKLALKNHPDIIILDIRMPVMDGITMLDALRKDRWGRSVKVLLLTNLMGSKQMLEKINSDHYTHYYIKSDIKLVDLIRKVHQLLT